MPHMPKKVSIFQNAMSCSYLKYTDVIFLIYGYCLDIRVNQMYNLVDVGEEAIINFKKRTDVCVQNLLECSEERLGGVNMTIQVYEIAFRRGELVTNPTSKVYNYCKRIWIIIGVMEMTPEETSNGEKRDFF